MPAMTRPLPNRKPHTNSSINNKTCVDVGIGASDAGLLLVFSAAAAEVAGTGSDELCFKKNNMAARELHEKHHWRERWMEQSRESGGEASPATAATRDQSCGSARKRRRRRIISDIEHAEVPCSL